MYPGYILLFSLFISGCATQYYHPEITDPVFSERQQAMDETYCTQIAAGAYIPPPVRIYQPSNYDVSGTVTTLGSRGATTSNYSGTMRSSGGGFASQFNQGANAAAPLAAAIAQARIIGTCMKGFGWTKTQPKKD